MFAFLKPAHHITKLSNNKIDPVYKKLRMQVFIGIFVGYAAYYLIRKNFALAIPDLEKLGYSKGELGIVLSAVSLAYGFSKFFMGNISDRSNARYFLPLGLVLSAATMLIFGFSSFATSSVLIMFCLMFINGWFQGMGWPPCGRIMVHWYSSKERGKVVSFWNIAHNVGGGLMGNIAIWGYGYFNNDWHAYFYLPAGIAVGIAIFLLLIMKDTPQSCGLPPIEEYKNDYPEGYSKKSEIELSSKKIFVEYVLKNKTLWIIAFANVFIYFIRYGILDWAPTYLQEVKNFSIAKSGWAYALYEYAAIPGTILCGVTSDKLFKGKRAPAGIIFIALTLLAVLVYWVNRSSPLIDSLAIISIGFLIYGPVMLIGLHALELAPKKAAGTAAGFTGLFGYLGGALFANAITGFIIDHMGWNYYFILMLIAGLISIVLLLFTWHNHTTYKS